MPKTWIEVALNGPWTRTRQPNIPVTVDEIVREGIACAKAGAAIIHLHAYDETSGRQKDDWQIYARIIEGIRAKADAIVYPTLPMSGLTGDLLNAKQRYAHVEELAKRSLLEWAVIDPGSAHLARIDDLKRGKGGSIYLNPDEHFLEGMRIAAQYRVRPSLAIYEPACTRIGAAVASGMPTVPRPVYRFMFSDEFCFGFPPRETYLDAHLALVHELAPGAQFMVAGLGVDIRPLIAPAIARGGHVRVGLEDTLWNSAATNIALVEEAVRLVASAGGTPATTADVRDALAVAASP